MTPASPPATGRSRRRWGRPPGSGLAAAVGPALAVLALVTALAVGSAPAGAHSILVGTEPEAGAEVPALTEVRLEFADDVAPSGHAVTLETDVGGAVAAARYEVPDPTTVVAHFTSGAVPVGSHEVAWTVVAADGHRETGRIPLTVNAGADASATSGSAPTAPSTPEPTVPPADSGPAATASPALPTASGEQAAGDADADDSSNATFAVVLAVGAGVAAGAYARSRWRASKRSDA